MSGARVLILGVAYKPDIDDVRESPAAEADRAHSGTRGPRSPTPRSARALAAGAGSLVSRARARRAYDCVTIVADHSEIDYDDLVDPRLPDRRPAQRDRRRASARARYGSSDAQGRHRRPEPLGLELVRNFEALADLRVLCDLSPDLREGFARRYWYARHRGFLRARGGPRARRDRDRDTRADALRPREASTRRRQARVRREAAGDARRGGRLRGARGRARAHLHARASAALPPCGAEAEAARRCRRARRRALRVRQPPEPRDHPQGRERSGRSASTTPLRSSSICSTRSRRAKPGRKGTRSSTPASRTSSSTTCASRAARSRTCTGSTRIDAKDHGRRPGQDGRLRRHGSRAEGDDLREGP